MAERSVAVTPGFWATTNADEALHACRRFAARTLCGQVVAKHIATSIPEPKTVDCMACLDAGAYNVPRPASGRYQGVVHTALVPSR